MQQDKFLIMYFKIRRIWRWIKSPWRCKIGNHKPNWNEIGFLGGSNELNVECKLCHASFLIPIDDLTEEGKKHYNELKSNIEEDDKYYDDIAREDLDKEEDE